jgi:hypothetical protein
MAALPNCTTSWLHSLAGMNPREKGLLSVGLTTVPVYASGARVSRDGITSP